MTLEAVSDTISIAGLSAAQTDFYLITQQSSGFDADPFDGIFGKLIWQEDGVSILTYIVLGMGYDGSGTVFQNLVNQGLPGQSASIPKSLRS